MKKQLFPLLMCCMAFSWLSCVKALRPQEDGPVTGQPQEAASVAAAAYQLVWQDEFDGSSVNLSKWVFENGNLHVNNERQYYQAANASVSNGNLVITARKQTVEGQPYTSARLNTNGRFTTQYGRIEARIKLPSAQGLWPAFWMLGANIGTVGWPKCGEIDIMEQVNTSNTIYGTIHWDANGYARYGGTTATSFTDYHVYAVEWDASEIRWYVDNNLFTRANILSNINSTEEFHKPFFIILNLAVGGDFPGQTIDDSRLPASMYVDYVRVYSGSSGPGGSAPIGATISIRGNNNAFISSENGLQPIMCNRAAAAGWEQFTVVDAGGGKIALQNQGKYVSSENGASMTCNRTSLGDTEKFDWIAHPDGTFSLRGNNGQYVSSENGEQPMHCNRAVIDAWEKFRY